MPLTLVATPGAANANTYATQAEANALAAELFPVPTWSSVGDDSQKRALITAARLLDRLSWVGRRATSTQVLEWPRVDAGKPGLYGEVFATTEIPAAVKQAQSRLAIWLATQPAANGDPLLSGNLAGLSSFSLGGEFSASFEPGQSGVSPVRRFFGDEIRPILAGLVYAAQPRLVRG